MRTKLKIRRHIKGANDGHLSIITSIDTTYLGNFERLPKKTGDSLVSV